MAHAAAYHCHLSGQRPPVAAAFMTILYALVSTYSVIYGNYFTMGKTRTVAIPQKHNTPKPQFLTDMQLLTTAELIIV